MHADAHENAQLSLAQLAVESNHLTQQQSDEALTTWRSGAHGKNFGMFLVAQNYISPETLWELTRTRDQRMKLATAAAANGFNAAASDKETKPGTEEANGTAPKLSIVKGSGGQAAQAQRKSDTDDQAVRFSYQPGMSLSNLLQQAMEMQASDLHVHSGAPLTLRIGGDLRRATDDELPLEECERLVREALSESQRAELEQSHQVDFAFELPGIGRFRANAFKQQRGLDAVFRTIRPSPPTLAELGMPEDLKRVADYHQGLVLFTGPAGCGKSSTMAALVKLINESRPDHILSIEDPVEYVHESASCNVNQREVGAQTESFPRALRAALREDPDVIVIGELRDLETISLAITAAETGHLVLGTLHTSNAIRTINRLLSVFPPGQQAQIRVMLSESLKAVISQRLVKRADGKGRVPAIEVMINNGAVGNLIRDCKTHQIKSVLQTGAGQGQRLLDASLTALLKDKVIKQEEALRHAEDPAAFR